MWVYACAYISIHTYLHVYTCTCTHGCNLLMCRQQCASVAGDDMCAYICRHTLLMCR